MERKIGEIFKVGGDWYQCIVGNSCDNCAFTEINCDAVPIGYCYAHGRKDNKSVIFKKLEKVGEPFAYTFTTGKIYNVLMQQYKVYYDEIIPFVINHFFVLNHQTNTIAIEIKQDKENMEEKKTNFVETIDTLCKRYNMSEVMLELKETIKDQDKEYNLKPFNLEAAKAGKPVCTRDGRKARIICFDRISGDDYYKIVACVTAFDGDFEEVLFYGIDGYIVDSQNPKDNDLMMLPEKKEGWVNVYKDGDNNYRSTIYTNEKVALSRKGSDCITTIKISWEE